MLVYSSLHPHVLDCTSATLLARAEKLREEFCGVGLRGSCGMQHPPFQRFMAMIRRNSREFEAGGRILRLKQYMVSDANCAMMEAVIAALRVNSRVQALYIQNFEAVSRVTRTGAYLGLARGGVPSAACLSHPRRCEHQLAESYRKGRGEGCITTGRR